jgi:hypothetical protein
MVGRALPYFEKWDGTGGTPMSQLSGGLADGVRRWRLVRMRKAWLMLLRGGAVGSGGCFAASGLVAALAW